MTARMMMRGVMAAALVLAGAAGCNSSIGSNATGTAGSGAGTAGAAGTGNGASGTGGTTSGVAGQIDEGIGGSSIAGTGGSSAGTSGAAGTTGAAGAGGTTGAAGAGGTTGAAGRGGTTGAAGRGGTTGAAGAGGRGGSTAGTTGSAGAAGGGTAGSTGAGGAAGAAMPSAGCGKTLTSTADATITIDVSGTSRSFIVSVPSTYDANAPHRLVFAFHGRTGTAMQIAQGRFYGLKQTGRMPNDVFVAPQGLGTATDATDTGWPNTNGQDIAFVRAALAYMNTNYCVDQARVFSVGFSYGGIMSHTIACQMSDTFRAVAPMAGAIFGRPTCQTHPIAAWMTHGTMDTSAAGGVDFTAGQSARDRIVTLNHCTTTTVAVDPSPCVAYQGCDGGYPVHWCQHDGAHVIPSFAAAAVSNFFLQF